MKNEKTKLQLKAEMKWNRIGVILGVLLIIMGILFMIFIYGDLQNTISSAGLFNSTKYGADFYTDVYDKIFDIQNNTYETASATMQVSDNLGLLGGAAFIACGMIVLVHYCKALAICKVINKEDNETLDTSREAEAL